MKKLLFLFTLISLTSCQDKFEPNKFNGDWISMDKDGGFSSLPIIKFKNDSIYFIDLYGYTTRAKFKVTRNKISYFFKNDTLANKFKFSSKDSTIVIGNNKYNFWEEYSDFKDLSNYKLIGIKSRKNIIPDSLRGSTDGFHLLKIKDDSLRIRLNDYITTDLNKLSYFVHNTGLHEPFPFSSTIYIGRNVNLKNLINCYITLAASNRYKTIIVTDYNFKENSYSIFYDRIYLWQEQIESYSKVNNLPPTPPPHPDSFRKNYLKKYSPKILTINSLADFNLLENINPSNNYLISINSEMKLETYLRLKEKIIEIKRSKKIKIKTEFILYPPN